MTARLSCCRPIAYDGQSRVLVHGMTCVTPERTLTKAELSEWRSRLAHPTTEKVTPLRPTYQGARGEWGEYWGDF